MNLPSLITWSRVVAIPIFILCYFLPTPHKNLVLSLLFMVAAFTDWLDGYLARKWNQTSSFGAFLDPVADKLLVAVALIAIVDHNPDQWFLTLSVMIIISREITISALREWMAGMGERGVVAVSWIGKWKTAFQMGAITFLLYEQNLFGLPLYNIGLIFLVIATFLTLWSMVQYLYSTWKVLSVK
ncbi:CDP-diacylglycerol--glycerol-3-phosphate 3-phosphatidyltransferase [Ignatzschineria sp. LJL83]